MSFSTVVYLCLCLCVAALVACGDDDDRADASCVPGTAEGCEGALVCEQVMDAEPACFAPVVVRGRVIDVASGQGVEGATVVALDINGAARSSVAVSDEDGSYAVNLPALRAEDGTVLADPITLRVAAAGYQAFPTPPREALPIEIAIEESEDDEHRLQNAATEVGLLALPGDRTDDAVIAGQVQVGAEDEAAAAAGALVVAVQGDRAVSAAIADLDGAFTLWNVPPGETRVEAYKAGLAVEAVTLQAASAERVDDVVLSAGEAELARVSGSVNIVDAQGGLQTTVILVPASTFDADTARGSAPAGLRASEVSGAFEIAGVPEGRYAVLAAFENDRLVRDPDQAIAGTDIVFIDVEPGVDQTLGESFKVTQALAVVSPGADAAELVPADSDPTFTWADDSSEDGYELRVYDAFGSLVHEALDVPRVSGSATVSYTWSAAPMERGMIYQFRVTSYREGRVMGGARSYISATEDLRGVFQAGEADNEGMEP